MTEAGESGLERLAAQAAAELQPAAPGVERVEVAAVNAKAARPLYKAREKIYPKLTQGRFRNIKWAIMAVALAIYYALPWMRWDRGEHLPDQAVLIDFPNQRFFFFFLEIWPQEFYFVTGLLILAALGLFLMTSLAGRVWCGYLCPQTVWTDLMIAIERFWQGDRNQRIRLDKQPWGPEKIRKKALTHGSWALVALATGGAFVFYFRDAPTLAGEFATLQAPMIAWIFLFLFAGTTYLLGGIAREQVCTYMCPWPRIQGAMFDADSLLVSYRPQRGEPRGPHKKGQSWEGRGDCVSCRQCVAVCPMGIDIRDGPQLECIQCALCIDACNGVMAKIGRPANLIAYETFRNLEAAETGEAAPLRLIRPRTILYAGLYCLVGLIMLVALGLRSELDLSVLRDRNPLFVTLSDGGVRNGFDVKLLNKTRDARAFTLSIEGLPNAQLRIVGGDGAAEVMAPPDDLRALRVYVTLPPDAAAKAPGETLDFSFVATDEASGVSARAATTFRKPRQ